MTEFNLVSAPNVLTFFPGLCSECKRRVVTVLFRRQDNERWFANLRSIGLKENWPIQPEETLYLHEHPGFRRTGLTDQYVSII